MTSIRFKLIGIATTAVFVALPATEALAYGSGRF